VPSPHWVAAIEDAFASSPDLAAVTGPVFPLGPETPGLYAVSSRVSTTRKEYTGRALPWLVGTGANFAVKRAWIERVGRYDERLGAGSPGSGGEDLEILHRLLMAGGTIRYEPDALIYHERQSRERRVATRMSYGRGMGAFCGVWLRRRNLYALALLWYWTRDRLLAGLRAAIHANWEALREELLLLRGMASGVVYGFTRPPAGGPLEHTPGRQEG
jgi:GT2 family glycosyltransferase